MAPPATPTTTPEPAPERPANLKALFWAFTWLALQGFGGVLAVVQRELVTRRRWLSNEEFIEDWAVAQILPGPNVVNLSIMIGDRYFGLRGAATAVLGMLAIPTFLVVGLAVVYLHFSSIPQVAGALRGMGAVAAGLVMGAGLRLTGALARHPLGGPLAMAFAVVTFIAMGLLRLPLGWVLLVVGGFACTLTWFRLGLAAASTLHGEPRP
ncbi:chromate transporter [Diaphorobacter ruginosibacter]|uniref:Chromate transporter n=1 Tax=Diaphorobacter ruginosibacter TaxID=1715720 RepID=A0A7G9RID2_9BURK|nr:chromate transporter [Diaphorobacter ruginosibacter]QNN55357.1 chromate transporter [Diaphorobacter ruginosibacter]